MHEAALMVDLVRQIEQVALQEGGSRVTGVRVWLGALSHFTATHFRDHFDAAAQGTIAAGAAVDVTLSSDLDHPDAQGVRLEDITIA